jgi:hypothetical protein
MKTTRRLGFCPASTFNSIGLGTYTVNAQAVVHTQWRYMRYYADKVRTVVPALSKVRMGVHCQSVGGNMLSKYGRHSRHKGSRGRNMYTSQVTCDSTVPDSADNGLFFPAKPLSLVELVRFLM